MTLSPVVRYLLRYVALAYLLVLLIVPVGLILWRTFSPGIGTFIANVSTPAAISALQLSLIVVAIVVPLNVLFGVPTALQQCLECLDVRGQRAIEQPSPGQRVH